MNRLAFAHGDIGGNVELLEPHLIHAERLDDAWRLANTALTRASFTLSAGSGSSGSASRKCAGICWLFFQPCWNARYLSRLTSAPPSQSAVKPPWLAGHPDAAGVDIFAAGGIAQEEVDVEADIDRALPELAGEIGDGRIVVVGPATI